jgi:hypothetical protein
MVLDQLTVDSEILLTGMGVPLQYNTTLLILNNNRTSFFYKEYVKMKTVSK